MQSQQSLELRQRQQLALTPELQQSIRFLQLSAMELNQELAQAVLDNPMLESESEYGTEEHDALAGDSPVLTVDWTGAGRSRRARDNEDDGDGPQAVVVETLQDYLLRQLSLRRAHAHARDDALVKALAYELNEDGYLLTPLADCVAYLQQYIPVSEAEMRAALAVLQSLEPAGIGARSLGECLALQLKRLPRQDVAGEGSAVFDCAMRIVNEHLDLLATGNLIRLRQALACDGAILKAAHGLLLSLEPRPARDFADNVAPYVVPDVLIRKMGQHWRVVLNPAVIPRVRVHSEYGAWLESMKADHAPLREKLQQAQALIKNLHHRGDTILRVSQAIVAHQQDYLEQGAQGMRPLVLRDIAQKLDIHESTVSRATRFKYAQTPHGVIELRAFFGSTLNTQDGGSTSGSAVQSMIAQLVAGESRTKPLSDNKIAQLLEQQGVSVARRTVAKYREAVGIEPAIRRKARYSLGR